MHVFFLSGNIRVFCRVRPKIKEDGGGIMGNIVVDYDRDDNGLIYVNNKGRSQTFEMDLVFTPESTQQQVRVRVVFVEKDMIKMSKRYTAHFLPSFHTCTSHTKTLNTNAVAVDISVLLITSRLCQNNLWKVSVHV